MYSPPIEKVLALLEDAIDPQVIEAGRRRQEDVWLGKIPDYLPLLLGYMPANAGGLRHDRRYQHAEHELVGGIVVEELEQYPHFNLIEQFTDPEKMLYEALWDMIGWARARSDAQLSIRNNFLDWVLASAFGMNPRFDEVETPWAVDHLEKSKLGELTIEGMENHDLIQRSLKFIEYFNRHLPKHVHQYTSDSGGPLSQTNYLFGNEWLWTDFYDDPDFINKALYFCTEVHKYMGDIYKKAAGENGRYSYNGPLFISGNATKVVDDCNVMLSPAHWKRFVKPRISECFEYFGTGWYHSCGHFPEKLDLLLEIPHLRAINFGNPEMWDQDDAVKRIIRSGKIYYGAWCRKPDEKLEDYLRRALLATGGEKKGLIIFLHETHGQTLPHPEKIMELWHKLQDQGV